MADATLLNTPLRRWHESHAGRLVPFAGWRMPLSYGSILEEHQAVRTRAGLFDISHMGRLAFLGDGVLDWLERVTTNHVARLADGQIQYSLVLNDAGGILDDILVYRMGDGYSVVCNGSNRETVVARFEAHRPAGAELADRTLETAMIAVQGPAALEVLQPLCTAALAPLRYYHGTPGRVAGVAAHVSRTGYTGEDGFELVVPADRAAEVWEAIHGRGAELGMLPCGLGARDTLRFEAAMPLYGHELSEEISPYEVGIGWAVKPAKGDFLGRDGLASRTSTPGRTRVGLALEGRRIARQGYPVLRDGQPVGAVTSGTFAPTLGRSLCMALVDPSSAEPGQALDIDLRGQPEPARVVALPFYRRDRFLASNLEKS